jgi:hypothetical protein
MGQHIGSLKFDDCMWVHYDRIFLGTAGYRRALRRFETVNSVQRNFNTKKTFYFIESDSLSTVGQNTLKIRMST